MSDIFTDIKVFPITGGKKNLAHGSALVKGTIQVKFTVQDGQHGLFAMIPSSQYTKDGEVKYNKHYYFPDKEVRQEFQNLVIAQYNEVMGKDSSQGDNAKSGEENQATEDTPAVDNIPW